MNIMDCHYFDNAYIAKAAQHIPAICSGVGMTLRIINEISTVTIGDRPSIGETITALPKRYAYTSVSAPIEFRICMPKHVQLAPATLS